MNSIIKTALEAASRLEASGHSTAVVGGAVRDVLLCREVRDADIATSASMDEIVSIWPGCKLVGKHPLTTALIVINGVKLDIASFQGACLEDDLARRDLTINSMAMTPGGNIIDPWGGAADITSGVLRFTGKPEDRLKEDPLRALRLARFAAVLPYFSVDPASAGACRAFSRDLALIPLPRIGKEMLLALDEDLPLFLESLETLGILQAALPFIGGLNHPAGNRTLRRAKLAAKMTADRRVRAAALLAEAGEDRVKMAISWGWPRSLTANIESLNRWLFLTRERIDPGVFGRLFRTQGTEWVDRLFLFGLVDCLSGNPEKTAAWIANRMKASAYSLRLASFADSLAGGDIASLTGIASGPIVGEVLAVVYGAVAEGLVKDREDALEFAAAWIKENRSEAAL